MPFSSSFRSTASSIPLTSASSFSPARNTSSRSSLNVAETSLASPPSSSWFLVARQHRKLCLGCPQRQLLTLELDPGGQDRVLERVFALCQLGRDQAGLAGLAQSVETLAFLARSRLGLGIAQRGQLVAREQLRIARDDLGALGDFLFANAHRAAFLGALGQEALQARLVVGRPQDGRGDAHRGRNRPARCQLAHDVEQLLEPERLRDDAVGLADRGRVKPRAAGEEDDRRAVLPVSQRAHQGESVVGADVNVEQEEVDHVHGQCVLGGRDARRLEHVVAVELQVDPAEQTQRVVVVDDQNRRHFGVGSYGHRVSVSPFRPFYHSEMRNSADCFPHPTPIFRRRSWLVFQRALDPLASPRRLPTSRKSDSSRPRSSRLSKRPGETFDPVTARRIG